MTRHPTDNREATGSEKTRAFFELARRETTHPSVHELMRRPREEGEKERLEAFLRIERGHRA